MINYETLNDASNHYLDHGYTRIETPWMVTEEVDSITRPKEKTPYVINGKNKNLIASGEQGFLYLMLKQYLPPGQYQTITPCFRDEPYDFEHSKTFMKLELINTLYVDEDNLITMIRDAETYFTEFLGETSVHRKKTGNYSYDLEYQGVELGSYGIREYKHLKWIYGTGLAEPRFSRILKIKKNNDVF